MAFAAFAVTAPGIESITAGELRAFGVAPQAIEHGGISFDASEPTLARALLSLRTATRVLVRAASFRATTFARLEQRSRAVPWAQWLPAGATIELRVTCRKSRLYHSDAVAERVMGAIGDAVRGVTHRASPDGETEGAADAQLIVVRVAHDECTISIDASGEALHRRGYRQAVAKAPFRETLAAAMLLGAGWDGSTALLDPMCGSGTIVIEGALIARRIAPGLSRGHIAERWPVADASVWTSARDQAAAAVLPSVDVPLRGMDRDAGAVAAARANAERAGVAADVEFEVGSLSNARPMAERGLLVTNPPYGKRTGDPGTLRNLYARLGALAAGPFVAWDFAVLASDRALIGQLGRVHTEWTGVNGGIPVAFVRVLQR